MTQAEERKSGDDFHEPSSVCNYWPPVCSEFKATVKGCKLESVTESVAEYPGMNFSKFLKLVQIRLHRKTNSGV